MKLFYFVLIILQFNIHAVYSQEWNSLRDYKKETGETELKKGCWLKKDRNKNTTTWQHANQYNLTQTKGNLKYRTISQIRDFYLWFDEERKKQGHEIKAVGVAAIVAGQLSLFDNFFIRTLIIRNKEIVWFGNEGSKNVIAFAFPFLKKVYFSEKPLIGVAAKNWDIEKGKIEQCEIVEAIYNQLSEKSIRQLERMAQGKGIYYLGVSKDLKFEGDIKNCKDRYMHAFTKLHDHYLEENPNKVIALK